MSIDDLTWGKPDKNQIDEMKTSEILRTMVKNGHYQKLVKYAPEKNSSEYTLREMKYLINLSKSLTPNEIDFVNKADKDLFRIFSNATLKYGIYSSPENLKELVEPFGPLIGALKFNFNRPRPHQLAEELNMEFFPAINEVPNSPAYPSGHALYSFIIADYLSEAHPQYTDYFWKMANLLSNSRLQGGVHFPSDEQAAYVTYRLLKHYKYLVSE